MFAVAYDGFVQYGRYATVEEARVRWEKDIKNKWLYEYDCSVYELDENEKIVRKVPFADLAG